MRQYKIYTENKNKQATLNLVRYFFEGFSIYEGLGYWKGDRELSLIIEINSDKPEAKENIRAIGYAIKRHNQQQAVLTTEQEIKQEII